MTKKEKTIELPFYGKWSRSTIKEQAKFEYSCYMWFLPGGEEARRQAENTVSNSYRKRVKDYKRHSLFSLRGAINELEEAEKTISDIRKASIVIDNMFNGENN